MLRSTTRPLLTALLLVASSALSCFRSAAPGVDRERPASPAIGGTQPRSERQRLRRFLFSRATQQDAEGFYAQPAGLAEDYPEESTTRARIAEDLQRVRLSGARALRFAIGWDGIELAKGRYDWGFWDALVSQASAQGIVLLPYVCYTPSWAARPGQGAYRQPPKHPEDFAAFMSAVVDRYKSSIHSWELWNEPDLPDYWGGTAREFSDMASRGARAVRESDPSAIIVLGGMSKGDTPFYRTAVGDERLRGLIDVVNVHGYLETWGEERAETYPERILAMAGPWPRTRALRPDLWMAEFGYSSRRHSPRSASLWGVTVVHRHEHTPAFQAVALLRHHLLALSTQQLSLTTWYRLRDLPPGEPVIGDDNNKFLGLLDVEGRPKPAWHAFQLYAQLFTAPLRLARDERLVPKAAGNQSVAFAFERKGGGVLVAAWLRSVLPSEIADTSGTAEDARVEDVLVPVQAPASVRRWHAGPQGLVEEPAVMTREPVKLTLRGDTIEILEWKSP